MTSPVTRDDDDISQLIKVILATTRVDKMGSKTRKLGPMCSHGEEGGGGGGADLV